METNRETICRFIMHQPPENIQHAEPLSADDWVALRKTYEHKGIESLRRAAEVIELLGSLCKKHVYPEHCIIYTDDTLMFDWRYVTLHLLHEIDDKDPQYYHVQSFPNPMKQTEAKSWSYDTVQEAVEQLRVILSQ